MNFEKTEALRVQQRCDALDDHDFRMHSSFFLFPFSFFLFSFSSASLLANAGILPLAG
jgi:hypothetical protein